MIGLRDESILRFEKSIHCLVEQVIDGLWQEERHPTIYIDMAWKLLQVFGVNFEVVRYFVDSYRRYKQIWDNVK